jgi:phospholipase C
MARRRAALVLLVAALSVIGAVSYAILRRDERRGRAWAGVVAPRPPCGTAGRSPATYRHVVLLVMENKDYHDIIDADETPYMTALAAACGVAANFFAETHPSAPNYIAMTSGGTHGLVNDDDPIAHPIDAPSIFSQLGSGGWRALAEAMPSNCRLRYRLPEYYARHNAPAYYSNVRRDCLKYDVPLGRTPDLSARFTFIAPSSCHSMHTCKAAVGDAWLEHFMPKVFASPEYRAGRTAVFLTFDESRGSGSNRIPTIVMAPSVRPGAVVRERFDHYSLLRTMQELLGLRELLGDAATAQSMRRAFGI